MWFVLSPKDHIRTMWSALTKVFHRSHRCVGLKLVSHSIPATLGFGVLWRMPSPVRRGMHSPLSIDGHWGRSCLLCAFPLVEENHIPRGGVLDAAGNGMHAACRVVGVPIALDAPKAHVHEFICNSSTDVLPFCPPLARPCESHEPTHVLFLRNPSFVDVLVVEELQLFILSRNQGDGWRSAIEH